MTRLEEEMALMDIVSNLKTENAQLKKALELMAEHSNWCDLRWQCIDGGCLQCIVDHAMAEAKE